MYGPPGTRPYWSTSPWLTSGLGVKLRVNETFYVAPEAQVGLPLVLLFSVRLGFRF